MSPEDCTPLPHAPSSLSGYCGRFAPAPTGSLHFGSLVAALASYLDARAANGEWLLRIEDVETSRIVPKAADQIIRTLEAFGFEWDRAVLFQSDRLDRYHAALVHLQLEGDAFPCSCDMRAVLSSHHTLSIDGECIYPGTCRRGMAEGEAARVWRLRVPDREFSFIDRIQGPLTQNLEKELGDFALFRTDGQFSYHLAVVIDDAEQKVNHVVRGADLLNSTVRQIWLQQCLGLPPMRYAHIPVVVNATGQKISKRTFAASLDPAGGNALLVEAMRFLGHTVPDDLIKAPVREFWPWAINAWSIDLVPRAQGIFTGYDLN